LLYTRF